MSRLLLRGTVVIALVLLARPALAQTPAQQNPPATSPQAPAAGAQQPAPISQRVEVISTKLPEPTETAPAAVEVITGDELRDRGATTLGQALALATGVAIAPGGDNGPASSVPEFWGLREFDAFLLVVDGVPWGGAFNPALTTLALHDIDHIEILRGAAPVSFGATSFVGVIHVVHKKDAATKTFVDLHGGQYTTGGAAADIALAPGAGWQPRLSMDVDRQGFSDNRTSFGRGHALFRASHDNGKGAQMWVTGDLTLLRQDPGSPRPVDANGLSPLVPVDANANPKGAFLDDNRLTAAWGMSRVVHKDVQWVTTASFSHSSQSVFRGFLSDMAATANDATGLREDIHLTDLYADSHFVWPGRHHMRVVAGADYLHGKGNSVGATFDYTTPLAGSTDGVSVAQPTVLDLGNEDRREFFGAYGLLQWDVTPRLQATAGIRANVTFEERGGSPAEEAAAKAAGEKDHGVLHAAPSGSVGVMYTAWQQGRNAVRVYGNYRGTFKPAAFDFGLGNDAAAIDPDKTLLDPETAQSLEGGIKTASLNGRLTMDASVFRMDFNNLVTSTVIGGLPALRNAGKTRFEGFEGSADLRVAPALSGRVTYSFHNGRYVDFTQLEDDGSSRQLAGNRFEMSARQLFSAGLVYARAQGVLASAVLNYTGNRFIDAENSVPAPGFATVDVGGGYRTRSLEIRADLRNITNRRDPISVSELGDGQVYLMTARSFLVTVRLSY